MDEDAEADFERWFSALETVPDGGREITAAFDSFTDNDILDLVREAAEFSLVSGGFSWIGS
jgi:hypothetical protein